jgi:hypothetical protein
MSTTAIPGPVRLSARRRTQSRSSPGISPAEKGRDMKRIAAVLVLALAFGASPAHSQHTVRLTWTASSAAAANPSPTYNVDRAATCPGNFMKINALPVNGTSYVGASAATGAAYCYQLTAVLSGVESVRSNQGIAVVPPPSVRQAVCAHHGPGIGERRCVAPRPKRAALQSPPQ